MREYAPMMPAAQARKRAAWQNKIYQAHLKRRKPIVLDYGGRIISVHRNVFCPVPYEFNLLAKAAQKELQATDTVLDMGTGSGVQAILAASKVKRVLAVDVNPHAVRCASKNAATNGMGGRIKVVQSDLYTEVSGRFSLILFDPPFRWTAPRDLWERSTADEGYRTLRRFLCESKAHLTKKRQDHLGVRNFRRYCLFEALDQNERLSTTPASQAQPEERLDLSRVSADLLMRQNPPCGRYPGLACTRYFLPASDNISTETLRKPSFGLVCG
jgi:release factor glutamine methyltransferase